jgi:hypothetical protein
LRGAPSLLGCLGTAGRFRTADFCSRNRLTWCLTLRFFLLGDGAPWQQSQRQCRHRGNAENATSIHCVSPVAIRKDCSPRGSRCAHLRKLNGDQDRKKVGPWSYVPADGTSAALKIRDLRHAPLTALNKSYVTGCDKSSGGFHLGCFPYGRIAQHCGDPDHVGIVNSIEMRGPFLRTREPRACRWRRPEQLGTIGVSQGFFCSADIDCRHWRPS